MSEIELKVCPFCGAAADLRGRKTSMVNCTGCSASTFQLLEDKESAVRQWNTRAPQWQKIESAPKDGTRVLLWDSAGDGRAITGAWRVGSADDHETFTHWQPLPAPPEVP